MQTHDGSCQTKQDHTEEKHHFSTMFVDLIVTGLEALVGEGHVETCGDMDTSKNEER